MDTSFEHLPETQPNTARFALATLVVVAIAAGLGLFIYLEMTKVEVVAYLQVRRLTAESGWPKNLIDEESDCEFTRFRNTQLELLRSKVVLTRAVRDPSISGLSFLRYKSDPVGWLNENLRIDYPNNAELLRIRLSASDPIQAAQAVDAVIQTYLKEFVERRIADRYRVEEKLRGLQQAKAEMLLRDMKDAEQLAHALGAGADTSLELRLKQSHIRIEQESVDELDRHLQRLSLVSRCPHA